jgi:hypothetical protein
LSLLTANIFLTISLCSFWIRSYIRQRMKIMHADGMIIGSESGRRLKLVVTDVISLNQVFSMRILQLLILILIKYYKTHLKQTID